MIASDDFNRANAATLGARWDADYWGIDSNYAYGYGPAQFLTPHPSNSVRHVAYYDIIEEINSIDVRQVGDVYLIYVNYVDSSNYHVAKCEYLSEVSAKLTLAKVVAGVETTLGTPRTVVIAPHTEESIQFRTFKATINDNSFCADLTYGVLAGTWEETTPISNGIYVGIGTTGTSPGDERRIDNFYFEYHRDDKPGDLDCKFCVCRCAENPAPKVLVATFVGYGRMVGLTGCVIELEYDMDQSKWFSAPYPTEVCCGTPFELWIPCGPTYSLDEFILSMQTLCGGTGVPAPYTKIPDPDYSTCDPLYLRYGPYNIAVSDSACTCGFDGINSGYYYIEVTE